MEEGKNQLLDTIQKGPLNNFIVEVRGYAGELTVEVSPESVHEVLKTLRDMYDFNYLVDISTVDRYTDEKRFEVSYNIVSLKNRQRLRIATRVEEEHPVLDTVTDIWPSANWYEREAFDMMGVRFHNHPDLRRMYLPEDFEFFPMRKEFPLLGIPGSLPLPEKDPPKPYN